jgi:hypothetical protein
MKKIFLVIFLLFVLPNLSLADNWEPILKIGPILEKDIDLLSKRGSELSDQININLAKKFEILKLLFSPSISNLERGKLELEWQKLNNEWEILNYEDTFLTNLKLLLMIANENVSVIEFLLFYNKNLKGSKIIKDRIKFIIKGTLTQIERDLERRERFKLKSSYETIEVLNNIKSDLEKILEILK